MLFGIVLGCIYICQDAYVCTVLWSWQDLLIDTFTVHDLTRFEV